MKKKIRQIVESFEGGSNNLSISEVRTLLKEYNFEHTQTSGSHEVWHNKEMGKRQVIVNKQGQVARYIVKQIIEKIREYYGHQI